MRGPRCRWCNQDRPMAKNHQHAMQCPARATVKRLMAEGKPHPSGQDPILVLGATLFNGKIERVES